jgi:DNA sulfur modification protein DndC
MAARQATTSLFAAGARMVHQEAVELTLASLRAYWGQHNHIAIAWSGGKDSTATLTLLVHLIEAGELPQPERLYVFYADTRLELPPLQEAANAIMAKLRERAWIEVKVVRAPLDKRFLVYILGRGVPPPNNNTLRWCTRQIKVDPMSAALGSAIANLPGIALMITGVREGESAVRDGRIAMSCSKDGAECGQGGIKRFFPTRKASEAASRHWPRSSIGASASSGTGSKSMRRSPNSAAGRRASLPTPMAATKRKRSTPGPVASDARSRPMTRR